MTEQKQIKRTRNPNGAGGIYKRADGRYYGRIQIGTKPNGKPDLKFVYGKTPKEAQKKLDDLKILYATSEELGDKIVVDKTYKDMYADEYFLRWLRDEKFDSLQPASYDTLENTVLNHIIPAIGHFKMDRGASPEILTDLLITKPYRKGLSYSMVKKIYTAAKECFTRAKLLDHIETNPMEKVKMLPSDSFSLEDEELVIFTDDEIKRFKETIDLKNSKDEYIYKMGYIFIFVLNVGIRSGELLSLKWKDIDFKNRVVHIKTNLSEALDRDENGERIEREDGTLKKQIINKRTKTRSGKRTVPLNDNAIKALNIIKEQRYFGKNSYVFSTSSNKSMGKKNAYNMFNRILERSDIEQCGLHTLRHTFASMQLRNGVDIAVVSKLLGHASVSITYNIYIHIIEEQKAMAVNLTNI